MSTVQNTFIFCITEAALLEEFGLMHHLGNYGGGGGLPLQLVLRITWKTYLCNRDHIFETS